MPVLQITLVLKAGETLPADAAARIADAASAVFSTEAGRTWVRIDLLHTNMYAEDHGGPPPGVAPVFVSVLKAHLQGKRALAKEAKALGEGIAALLDRPAENVHILYEPPGTGRIAFGGNLLVR
jgi:phenylpyruvate tautomerase PptA (4-oxalocrotonate tautomerase family)